MKWEFKLALLPLEWLQESGSDAPPYLVVNTLSSGDSSTHGPWIGCPEWRRGMWGPTWPWLGQNKEGLRDWWTEGWSEMLELA